MPLCSCVQAEERARGLRNPPGDEIPSECCGRQALVGASWMFCKLTPSLEQLCKPGVSPASRQGSEWGFEEQALGNGGIQTQRL